MLIISVLPSNLKTGFGFVKERPQSKSRRELFVLLAVQKDKTILDMGIFHEIAAGCVRFAKLRIGDSFAVLSDEC